MERELSEYIARYDLEEVLEARDKEMGEAEAESYAESLSNLLWDIIEAVEEDRLIITEERRHDILSLTDRFYEFAVKGGGTEAMKRSGMSAEEARDGFKRVVEFNSIAQQGTL